MIKIFNLNLWRYNEFENRIINIIQSVENLQPDVIFLQESQLDIDQSFLTQEEIIKSKLNLDYKYSLHSTVYKKEYQKGQKLKDPIDHGMGIISKYPILNSFEYYLKQKDAGAEPRSVLFFDLEIEGILYKFINIHFTNKEEVAKQEMFEVFNLLERRNEKRILVGDFNMFNLTNYLEGLSDYKLSFDFSNYISYPKDNGTLDYILIPENYYFMEVKCLEEYMSDHKALFAKIKS